MSLRHFAFCAMASALAAGSARAEEAAELQRAPAAVQSASDTSGVQPSSTSSSYDTSQIPTGGNLLSRMLDDYKLEWGQAGPPADPHAPAARRDDYPPPPVGSPPYPFTGDYAFDKPACDGG